ncbi:MAG TPA: radical SAM protein [Thermoanaerobaculia bacterium]|nr:radical SAM protein [Thermoanaerobaculia bacterium]
MSFSGHGWALVESERKREIIAAIASGRATRGPAHVELDLTDRCNVACYFCNQQDVRTTQQLPLARLTELIGELVAGGLRSVRLSGGGDPLAHRDAGKVMDLLTEHGVVIDNLTTNGALLGPAIAERLVVNGCREVIFSLNAADPADYQRMMRVRPATFDRVVENVRRLAACRTAPARPAITVQFLIDRQNYSRIPEMYDLGRRLDADRIVITPVLQIPLLRVDFDVLLHVDDFHLLEPYLAEIVQADREAKLLQLFFPFAEWNTQLAELRARLEAAPAPASFQTARSFTLENGQCFFAWYTTTIRGNGDLYPCCMLMNPTYKPLGNTRTGSFREHWHGKTFRRLRTEMREILISGGQTPYSPERFKVLDSNCVVPHRCFLKNMYFRGDETFYRELGAALGQARKKESGRRAAPRRALRAALAFVLDAYRQWPAPIDRLHRRLRLLLARRPAD